MIPNVYKVATAAAAALIAMVAVVPSANAANGADDTEKPAYWRSTKDGWFWGKDPLPPAEPASAPQQTPAPAAPAPSQQDIDLAKFKDFQVRLERSLQAATMNPSEANLALFLELLAKSRSMASTFTDRAQSLAARMPWVDENAMGTRPANPIAQSVYDQVQMRTNDDLMRNLSQTHGLYFFFRGDCAYCHAYAPMLKQFEQKYGFTVFPISLDGGGIPLYPRPVRDNGMVARVMDALTIPQNQLQVPFTVLAKPSTGEVLPVGFGPMTAAEIVDRIALVVRMREGSKTTASNQVMDVLGGEGGQAVLTSRQASTRSSGAALSSAWR